MAPLDEQEPRDRQPEEDDRRRRDDECAQESRKTSRRGAPDQEDRAGQHQTDQALREEASRRRRARQGGHRRPGGACRLPAQDRRAPRQQRGRKEEGQQAVGQVRSREEKPHGRGEQEHAGKKPLAAGASACGGEDHEQRGSESRQPGRQPCCPRCLAEDPQARRVHPVEKRRLLEIGKAIQTGNDQVAGREHLARDFRVPRLVRLGQEGSAGFQPDHGQEQQKSGEQDSLVARIGLRLLHHRWPSVPSPMLRFHRLERLRYAVVVVRVWAVG